MAALHVFRAARERAWVRASAARATAVAMVVLAFRGAESARVAGPKDSAVSSSVLRPYEFDFECRPGPFGDEVVWRSKSGEEFGYATTVRNTVCTAIEKNKVAQRSLWQAHFADELFAVATYAFIVSPSTLSFSFHTATALLEGERRNGKFYLTIRGSSGGQSFTDSRHFLLPCTKKGPVGLSELRRALVQVWRKLKGAPDTVDGYFLGLDMEDDLRDLGLNQPSAPLVKQVWEFARHVRQEFEGESTGDKQAQSLVRNFGPSKLKSTNNVLDLGKILGYTAALTKIAQGPMKALLPEFLGFPTPQAVVASARRRSQRAESSN